MRIKGGGVLPTLPERREALNFLQELWATDREAYECLAHIPNGGARDAITGKRLKEEGLKPGYEDYTIDIAIGVWNGFRLELKALNGTISPFQIEWSDRHLMYNYASVIGWGAVHSINLWKTYRAGLLTKEMCLETRKKGKAR